MILLIVEDQELQAEIFRRNLRHFLGEIEIRTATTIGEAVDMIPAADVVLLDLNLPPDSPWKDTLGVLARNADAWPPVVCVTAHGERESTKLLAIAAGAEDFITKEHANVDPVALADKLWLAWARRHRSVLNPSPSHHVAAA